MDARVQVVNLRHMNGGGYGDVYLAERHDNGETVVVKVLREYHDPTARRFFAREIRILKNATNNGLVKIIAGNPDATKPYYIMPYYRGGPITKWAGHLSVDQIRNVARQLAAAVVSLHAQDVAHGDIKPDNILVADGELHLGDPLGNGNGCTIHYSANRGGTPGYWAPEVQQGWPISKSGDIFSFGATLFHLSTGIRPTDSGSKDPADWNVQVPEWLRDLIISCCKSEPGSRPSINVVQGALAYGLIVSEHDRDTKNFRQTLFEIGAGVVLGALLIGGIAALLGAGSRRD